jgi:hypothetical protein
VQAPAPEWPIDGGMATEAVMAHIVVGRLCDSLPLYRQAQMLKRITLCRSALSWQSNESKTESLVEPTHLAAACVCSVSARPAPPSRREIAAGPDRAASGWGSGTSLGASNPMILPAFAKVGGKATSHPCSRALGT